MAGLLLSAAGLGSPKNASPAPAANPPFAPYLAA